CDDATSRRIARDREVGVEDEALSGHRRLGSEEATADAVAPAPRAVASARHVPEERDVVEERPARCGPQRQTAPRTCTAIPRSRVAADRLVVAEDHVAQHDPAPVGKHAAPEGEGGAVAAAAALYPPARDGDALQHQTR